MSAPASHLWAAALLAVALPAILLLCRLLAARTPRPASIWGPGIYLIVLHLVYIYGLLAGRGFAGALPQLTLLTFPASANVGNPLIRQGFMTMLDLAANYVRYVLCFGGIDALLIAGFLAFAVPTRSLGLGARSRR
jgi:hypothetical protein